MLIREPKKIARPPGILKKLVFKERDLKAFVYD